MALFPHFDTPGVLLRFATGPQLRAWLDMPDQRHLLRVELALVEHETWQLHGGIDGLPGWAWHATIAPHDAPPTRWHQRLIVVAANALPCAITVALTDLGPIISRSDPLASVTTDQITAALIDSAQMAQCTLDGMFNTSLLLRSPGDHEQWHTTQRGQTLTIEHEIVLGPPLI